MAFFGQSEESKAIKRLNEQLKQVGALTQNTADNQLIAAWSRAMRESGIDFTKDKGTNRYRIRNTAQNRANIDKLQSELAKYKAKNVQAYQQDIKKQLQQEAAQKAEDNQLTGKERKKFIQQYSNKRAIKERIAKLGMSRRAQHMLDVIYNQTGNYELGEELRKLAKGVPVADRDESKIFNVMGRISDEFARIQAGALTEEEEERARERAALEDDFED